MLWRVVCNVRHMPLLFCHRFSFRCAAIGCATSLIIGISLLGPSPVHASTSHHQSEIDFARAVTIQHRLEAVPAHNRTRIQYERAIDAYRRVYHGDPASPDAPRSIAAVANLLASEGLCFQDGKLLHDAVGQWEFLRKQYPASSLRQRALFEEGQIQQYDLQDRAAAEKTYRLFLSKYPHDVLTEQVRASLPDNRVAEASVSRGPAIHQVESRTTTTAAASAPSAPVQQSQTQLTRPSPVVIVDNDPDSRPALNAAKPTTLSSTSPSTAVLLKDVRYWDENGSTRLAIDLSGEVPYHTYPEQNGRRITIVFYGAQSAATLVDRQIMASHDQNLGSVRVSTLAPMQATLVLQMKRPVSVSSFVLSNPSRLIVDLQPAMTTDFPQMMPPPMQHNITVEQRAVAVPAPTAALPPPAVKPIEETKQTAPAPYIPPSPVAPSSTVQPTMARVLGLRVRRIVIDAGHGGHDSGTIGPGGIEEKDIALDVALRLGHLLQQRLGAEVVYTRRTDKYVPLEERTAIANAAHADLFLSIHANSSSDPEVRGVETYFLNFTNSPGAMAVASRENADSNRSVYELSDLVRKIALSDKIDESREFAGDVQQQLYSGLLFGNPGLKNRGVKQAPFVVLIGAQMPSVLAEISFLTNPESASELARPRYRERLAESLYRGVAEYVAGMSGVRIAKTIPAETLAAPAE